MPQVTIKAGPRNYLYLRPRSSAAGFCFFAESVRIPARSPRTSISILPSAGVRMMSSTSVRRTSAASIRCRKLPWSDVREAQLPDGCQAFAKSDMGDEISHQKEAPSGSTTSPRSVVSSDWPFCLLSFAAKERPGEARALLPAPAPDRLCGHRPDRSADLEVPKCDSRTVPIVLLSRRSRSHHIHPIRMGMPSPTSEHGLCSPLCGDARSRRWRGRYSHRRSASLASRHACGRREADR